MTVAEQLKKAEREGKMISKQRLLEIIRLSNKQHYIIVREGRNEHVVIAI